MLSTTSAGIAKSFVERYQLFTSKPAPPPLTRLAASSIVPGAAHNYLIARTSSRRTADAVFIGRLQRAKDAEQLIHAAAQLLRVVEQRADIALGVNREYRSHARY